MKKRDLASITLSVIAERITPVGIVKDIFEKTVQKMDEERLQSFVEKLKDENVEITEEMIQSVDFAHSVLTIADAVKRTRSQEKIHCFAQLLISGILRDKLATDNFERYVAILDELQDDELHILQILYQCEKEYIVDVTGEKNRNRNEGAVRARAIWNRFKQRVNQECNVSNDLLPSLLIRLLRTGLYSQFAGMILNYEGEGQTTPLFDDFAEWIRLENNRLHNN